jgi:hypothetical protein
MFPQRGVTVVAPDGEQWIVIAVSYDEAGPEYVVVSKTRRDESARTLTLTLHEWCDFCRRESVGPFQDGGYLQ